MTSARRPLITVVAMVGVLVAACGSNPSSPAAPSSGTSVNPLLTVPSASPAVDASAASTGPDAALSGYGPGDITLADPTVGLDALDAYRSALTISFEGTEAGVNRHWTVTWTMAHDRAAGKTALWATSTGDTETPGPAFAAELDGSTIMLADVGGPCTVAPTDPGTTLRGRWEPARQLSGLIGAVADGTETIGGVAADRLTFDERALGLAGIATGEGTAWIGSGRARPLVRYDLRLLGDAALLGPDAAGTSTWTYELTDIDAPVSIDLPDSCPDASSAIAPMPDAKDIAGGSGALSFTTTASLEAVVAFYQDAASDGAWDEIGKPLVTGTTAFLEGVVDGRPVSLFADRRDGQTLVRLVVDEDR